MALYALRPCLRLRAAPALKHCRSRRRDAARRGRGCILTVQRSLSVSVASSSSSFPLQCSSTRRCTRGPCNTPGTRPFSGGNVGETTSKPSNDDADDEPTLLYEGPFASLTLKLKRISLTSAVIGIVGLPALTAFYGGASVPPTGQLAIIATAGVTAVGSTALLGYCFSPYVHTLERLPSSASVEGGSEGDGNTDATKIDVAGNQSLVRIVTRDILARRVETVFDPATEVAPPPENNSRPFCNFTVRGLPMYVHPELVHDRELRVQLVGEEEPKHDEVDANRKKTDDDEFL